MKTIKKIEIIPVFVDLIPDQLEQNHIYISKKYETSSHLCLCGCGNLAVIPFNNNGWWLMSEHNERISFAPSILNTNCPNRCHYIISDNIAHVV